MISIEKARLQDVHAIVRRNKLDEAKGSIIKTYFDRSVFSWCGFVDSSPACIWGLIAPTILSDQAYLWLTTTDLVKDHQFSFVRHSQIVIQDMLKTFPVIVGHVVQGQEQSIRWLKWLGVKLGRKLDGFIEFELRAHG